MALSDNTITNHLSQSSSSSRYSWTYDTFLNFRGKDSRDNFVSHLYTALTRAKLKVFQDENKIRMGRKIMATIFKAIEESRISILVFSPNYGESKSCLKELVKVLHCSQSNNDRFVYPVFYHVSPMEVEHQTGCFRQGFAVQQNHSKLEDWKKALAEAASLKGMEVKGNESECIENIVKFVLVELGPRRFAFGSLIPKGSACYSLSFHKPHGHTGPRQAAHSNVYDKLCEIFHIRLLNRKAVAIVNVSTTSQSDSEFLIEVSILSRLKHENVAKLYGYCIKDNARFLVEEHATRGTLDQLLHGARSSVPALTKRVMIAYDVAKGLQYLHDQNRLGHVDSSKVFLFRNLKAKISTGSSQSEIYQAPEYNEVGQTTKGDVYGFGVLLLELLAGSKPSKESMNSDLPILTVDNVRDFVDERLNRNEHSHQARKLAWAIFLTTQNEPNTRPDMNVVVRYLKPVIEAKEAR